MYRIKRHYQVAEKQPWLIDLLVKLKPSYFAPCQGIEEVQACTPQPKRGHKKSKS